MAILASEDTPHSLRGSTSTITCSNNCACSAFRLTAHVRYHALQADSFSATWGLPTFVAKLSKWPLDLRKQSALHDIQLTFFVACHKYCNMVLRDSPAFLLKLLREPSQRHSYAYVLRIPGKAQLAEIKVTAFSTTLFSASPSPVIDSATFHKVLTDCSSKVIFIREFVQVL